MPYNPKTWENKPSTASPINATNLNHMEGGIKNNNDDIITVQNAILTLQGEMLQAQGDITALETLVDSIFPVDTESGNPAVITDAFGGSAKSLKLTLEPIQSGSGTPSPQNVRPISGRTQSIIYHYGKNLFNASAITRRYASNPQTRLETGSIVKVNSGDKIVFSTNYADIQFGVIFFNDANKTTNIEDSGWLNPNTAYTIQHDGFICLGSIGIRYGNDTAFSDTDIANIKNAHTQLELGSTATDYEPYNGETITIDLDGTRYGGVLDVKTGVLTIDRAYVALDENNFNDETGQSAGGLYYYQWNTSNVRTGADEICYCNMLPSKYSAWGSTTPCIQLNDATKIRVYVEESTKADFKTAYAGMTFAYPLVTPITVQLTAEDVTLLHGDNVLTTDADSIEVSYSADIALYIDKKIAEGSQGNRSLSKGGSGDEEVKEEVKEEEIEIKEAEPLTKEVR